jgi:hypothetical protein
MRGAGCREAPEEGEAIIRNEFREPRPEGITGKS